MTNKEDALFHGAASEVVTPFTSNDNIDHCLLHEEIEYMISEGVTGIFVNGLASEFLMMGAEERFEAAGTVIKSVNGRVPVVSNVYSNSTQEACLMSRRYAELGSDAIMIFMPYVYPYTEQGMFEYCDRVAKSVDLPFYICNVPGINKFSPNLVARIFKANPSFRGYKDGTQNIIDQQTLLGLIDKNRHFELLAGSDAQIATTMMLGGVGVISLITVVFPKLIIDTVSACERNDWNTAMELQEKVIRVRQAIKKGSFMAAYKYVGNKIGHPLGHMRHPLKDISESDAQAIDAILSAEGMY